MTNAILSGTYADLKFIKTRSVAQIVVEIPIEQADAFVKMFGTPQPGRETPIAIARLNGEPTSCAASEPAPKRTNRAQVAGILCNDAIFWAFLREERRYGVHNAEDAARAVRDICGVSTRGALDGASDAAILWDLVLTDFRAWRALERVA